MGLGIYFSWQCLPEFNPHNVKTRSSCTHWNSRSFLATCKLKAFLGLVWATMKENKIVLTILEVKGLKKSINTILTFPTALKWESLLTCSRYVPRFVANIALISACHLLYMSSILFQSDLSFIVLKLHSNPKCPHMKFLI